MAYNLSNADAISVIQAAPKVTKQWQISAGSRSIQE